LLLVFIVIVAVNIAIAGILVNLATVVTAVILVNITIVVSVVMISIPIIVTYIIIALPSLLSLRQFHLVTVVIIALLSLHLLSFVIVVCFDFLVLSCCFYHSSHVTVVFAVAFLPFILGTLVILLDSHSRSYLLSF
jgi:hypothetical protein